jgi:hypothetical protein
VAVSKEQLRSYCRPFLRRKTFSFRRLAGLVEPAVLAGLRSGSSRCPGLVIHTRQLFGFPAYFYLGESSGRTLGRGSLHLGGDGEALFGLSITESAARVAQVLDYWLVSRGELAVRPDAFRISLTRAPRDQLLESLGKTQLSREEVPVLVALDVSCMRLMMERLEDMAQESGTPRDFMLRALNANLDSALSHEVAHLEEARTNGVLHPPHIVKEAIAYFLQALYADPADAFRSMMLRGFDITAMMPTFDEALRQLGPGCFCVERGFVWKWARAMLDALFERINGGKPHDAVVDVARIKAVQTSDFIAPQDMPLVERAICNPNLRISAEEWEAALRPAESG